MIGWNEKAKVWSLMLYKAAAPSQASSRSSSSSCSTTMSERRKKFQCHACSCRCSASFLHKRPQAATLSLVHSFLFSGYFLLLCVQFLSARVRLRVGFLKLDNNKHWRTNLTCLTLMFNNLWEKIVRQLTPTVCQPPKFTESPSAGTIYSNNWAILSSERARCFSSSSVCLPYEASVRTRAIADSTLPSAGLNCCFSRSYVHNDRVKERETVARSHCKKKSRGIVAQICGCTLLLFYYTYYTVRGDRSNVLYRTEPRTSTAWAW